MEKLLIDYNFNALEIESTNGDFKTQFTNSTIVTGPRNTTMGNYPKAINLGTSGKANVDLTGLILNSKKFCIQAAFKVNATVNNRQNIMESNFLPFAVYVSKGTTSSVFELNASVALDKHGWTKVDSLFKQSLRINRWFTVSLVYDHDTLGLFINKQLVTVHGFPNGLIKTHANKELFFGTWVDGARNHFNGCLAGFKWYDGIPSELESLLDEKRSSAEWHINYKQSQIKNKISTGKRLKRIVYDRLTGSHTQFYQNCGIMYHQSLGTAFEMHGSIYSKFQTMRNKSILGYLVTDESIATNRSGRKSLFSKGGIYWSRATGAFPVLDEIYLEYENLGESKVLGFPTRAVSNIPGGQEQRFQKCRMYYKNGTGRAQEVHGSILQKFLRIGGARKWGFPVTNESDIKKGSRIIGKYSEFEHCTIYWKSGVGAFEVHGSIRQKYNEINGPLSSLGFPTSNEVDIPQYSGIGKMNTFEKGSILWYGSYASIKVARPFKIRLQRIHSKESEGIGMGQNDMYYYITIKEGNRQLYKKRFPSNGDFGGHNVLNRNDTYPVEIMPNKINKRISFGVKIKESDTFDSDDHLGSKITILSAANAWGFRQPNLVFNQSFSKIKSFLWSIRPKINIARLTEKQKWWGFDNFKTPVISKNQYAAAFHDVDSETEWWDITDGLQNLYYHGVVKGIASGGNCFGMSLEAIYARKNSSLLNEPLIDVVENRTSVNEINIKHTYQVGARPIWWFLGQFVSGNTHDPKDVFRRTRNAFRRGDNPVVCIAQNYDFSGGPHCIMPYAWDTTSKPWKMKVMDPNFPKNDTKVLTVDPDRNEFKYVGSSRTYKGASWSGGRFHYMPFCVLNPPQRTPLWDAILLLLAGTILILADDAETVSIKDANGQDLDGNGTRAKQRLKAGGRPEEFFASYVGLDSGIHIKPGQILLRREKMVSTTSISTAVVNPTNLTLGALTTTHRLRGFTRSSLPTNTRVRNAVLTRSAHHVLSDTALSGTLTTAFRNRLKDITKLNNKRNFVHEIKGAKNGKLEYLIKSGLSEIKIESTIRGNELNEIKINDLGTNASRVEFKSPRAKNVNLQISNKLGVNGDFLSIDIAKIPVKAGKSLSFNVKQGLSGLEIVNNGAPTTLPVQIKGKVNGKKIIKNYTVPFEGTIRIKPSTIVHTNNILVSKLNKMFGTIKSTDVIKNK